MTPLLVATVRETLGEAKSLGAPPGIIAARHTWSQTLVRHPHLDGLVTGGGLTADGQGRAVHHGLLLPGRVVMAVLRGKRLAAIDTAVRGETRPLPTGMTRRQWETLRHQLGRLPWNGQIRERSPQGHGVRTDLARSIRGGPLAHPRVVSCAQGAVTFRDRRQGEGAAGGRRGLMTVPLAECMRRSRLHVPAPGTKVVRCDGLYAPTKGADVA